VTLNELGRHVLMLSLLLLSLLLLSLLLLSLLLLSLLLLLQLWMRLVSLNLNRLLPKNPEAATGTRAAYRRYSAFE
jgi:hypothetical protein